MNETQIAENIAHYVLAEKRTFAEKPITEVDLLAFSGLAYLAFEDYPDVFGCEPSGNICDENKLPLRLDSLIRILPEGVELNALLNIDSDKKRSWELLNAVISSPRFSEVQIAYFECQMTDIPLSRFAATLFYVPGEEALVLSFRGTDTTPEGWLDSMNMLSFESTPGMRRAICLPDDIVECLKGYDGLPIYLCGHSKGGCLAECALLLCSRHAAQRIVRAVSFDGPALFCLNNQKEAEYEEFDLALLHRYQMGRPIVRYTFPSLLGLVSERRDPHQFRCIASVDGKPRHGINFALIRGGEFVFCEPAEEEISNALYLSRLFPLLTDEERDFANNLLYEACKGTGLAADLSGRFVRRFIQTWKETTADLNEEDREIIEEIARKAELAESIVLPFEQG